MGRKPTKNVNLPPRMRARPRSNGKTYYYYDTGLVPRKEIPLGTDYVAAVRKWSELEADNSVSVAALVTFRYAATRYIKEVLPTKAARTQTDNLKELDFLLEFFDKPPAPLDEIKPMHIRQYMDWRVKKARALMLTKNEKRTDSGLPPLKIKGSEGQVRANREKALFSHIFNMARNWGMTSAPNPCAGIKGYSESGRDVYVEDDVFLRVYNAADQPTRDAMDLAYLTGQRPADTIKYDESDIQDGFLFVQQNKTTKKLRIQIVGQLKDVIDRILLRKSAMDGGAISSRLIVTDEGKEITQKTLTQRFYRLREKLGISGDEFQFRDLRAKAGTDKADSSGDIREAQKQLGHTSITMTEHYTRERKGDKVKPTK